MGTMVVEIGGDEYKLFYGVILYCGTPTNRCSNSAEFSQWLDGLCEHTLRVS